MPLGWTRALLGLGPGKDYVLASLSDSLSLSGLRSALIDAGIHNSG